MHTQLIIARNFCLLLVFVLLADILYAGDKKNMGNEASISVTLRTDITSLPDSVSLRVILFPDELSPIPQEILVKSPKKNMQWIIPSQKIVHISISSLKPTNESPYWLFEPGDNIIISFKEGKLSFSGKGFEKLNVENEISSAIRSIQKPSNPFSYITKSLDDFVEYNDYLNKQLAVIGSVLDVYKGRISDDAFNFIKATSIWDIEKNRAKKFHSLYIKYRREGVMSGITARQLCNLYDSACFNESAKWMRNQPFYFVGAKECFGFIRNQVIRNLNFPIDYSSEDHLLEIFEEGKKKYNGLAQQYFLYTTLISMVINDIGFNPQTEIILAKYCEELAFPAYKAQIKEAERKAGSFYVGKRAPAFALPDANGRLYNNKTMLGKLVLMNFCVGDCNNCKDVQEALKKIRLELQSDSNLLILNMGSPRFKTNFQVSEGEIYVLVSDSSLFKAYGIYNCNELRLIGPQGRALISTVPDPLLNGDKLLQLLREGLNDLKKTQWVTTHDGPYIMKEGNKTKVLYVADNKATEEIPGMPRKLLAHTDTQNQYFEIKLKDKVSNEPAVYNKPGRLLAISDIEGNFDVFRKLLQANKVMDENFNWTYGTGHLVLTGDMVDRGNQVTECLWLIYSLEEKAKAAGGYVHFILGNHEIMNLSGDIRYVQSKYKENALILKKNYTKDLYGENAELGKWLRSKNIMEKIGDLLFVHGGISKEINDLSLSLEQLNEIARPYYGKDSVARNSTNRIVSFLYNDNFSPFWYRLYYQVDSMRIGVGASRADTTYKTPSKTIDAVLANYQVSRIVTGHTVYKSSENAGKYVTIHYNGKVINTDTRHAQGYSEALLIEDDKFYKVDKEGKRSSLFVGNR